MRIASLTLTPLAEDARVRRTVDALVEAGHDVLAIARPPFPPPGGERRHALPATASPARQRAMLVATQAPATLVGAAAHPLYWLPATRRDALKATLAFRPDVIICNDWNTLPIGAAVKRRLGARLVYDSHEFATREHIQNWKWRLVSHRSVAAVEARGIRHADLVITVSDGIAAGLASLYGLGEKPLVIRNMPDFLSTVPRPSRIPLKVLFHGLVRAERGLEELVDSMPAWTFDGHLVIRGYGPQDYVANLRRRAEARGVANRVTFAPRVPPDRLIAEAQSADIGYLALPGTTDHYEFALPNKLFEYLMAGLAVLATPRAEIAAVLRETGAGCLAELTPQALAECLNGLDRGAIDGMRAAALEAAKRFNWQREKSRLVEAIDALSPQPGGSVAA
jgi:glycogen synthase